MINLNDHSRLIKLISVTQDCIFFKMLSTWSAYKCFQVSKTAKQFTTYGENEKEGEKKPVILSCMHTFKKKIKSPKVSN